MNNIIRRSWNMYSMVNIEDLRGSAFQAEDGGHTFEITGLDANGNATAISGTVAAVFLRPDNTDVAIAGSVSNGKAYVTLTDECYGYPGRFGLTIFLTSGGQKVAIYAAIGSVHRTSSGAVSPETAQDVVDLINEIEAAIAQIPASYTDIMAAVAPTYSNTVLYPVGSYAWYEGKLYRCVVAITTAESWTSEHWTAAKLASDVSELASGFSDLKGSLTGAGLVFPDVVYNRGYVKPNGTIDTNTTHYKYSNPIQMKAGQTIYVYTESTLGNVAVISLYSSGTYTQTRNAKSNGYYLYKYSATSDCSVVVCVKKDNPYYVYGNWFPDFRDATDIVEKITEKSTNLFIISKAIPGRFISYNTSTGEKTINENSSWMTVEVPVNPGQTYSFTHNGFYHYFLTASGNYVSRVGNGQSQTNVTYTAPATAAKILLNIRVTTTNSFMMVEGDTIPSTYTEGFVSPRVKSQYIELPGSEDDENTYYVGRGGSGDKDFTDPISCFNAIQDNPEYKKVIIYPGTYDIYTLLGGDAFFNSIDTSTQSYYDVQPWLSNVEIIGFGKVVFELNIPTTIPAETRRYFSPLNVRGNAKVRNIQIVAKNCRYCIHDESGSNYRYTERVFENITCDIRGGEQAIGSGYSMYSTVSVKNCYLYSGTNAAFSCHTKGQTNLTLENCIIKTDAGSYPAVRVSQESNQYSKVNINNCTLITPFAHQLRLNAEYDYYENKIGMTHVDIINSNITSVQTADATNPYDTITEPVTKYNTIDGTVTVIVSAE